MSTHHLNQPSSAKSKLTFFRKYLVNFNQVLQLQSSETSLVTRKCIFFYKNSKCQLNLEHQIKWSRMHFYFTRITPCSLSTVASIWSIVISKNLVLNSVLLVPNLTCNKQFMSKIIRDLNCVDKFFPTHYEF